MKNRTKLTNRILWAGRWLPALAVSALLTASVAPALGDDGAVCSPGVIPPVVESHPYGHTYAGFLPAPLGGRTATRTGIVPEGTALFVPVLTFEVDNTGCPTYTDLTVA